MDSVKAPEIYEYKFMTEQQRKEFEAQLERADYRTTYELLNDPSKVALRDFYENHFDDIVQILGKLKPKAAVGEFSSLDANMKLEIEENFLFLYQANLAIVNGVLTKDLF